jgi:hypothetical protein
MKQRTGLTLLVSVAALNLLACQVSGITIDTGGRMIVRGSGDVVEEPREVGSFTAVELATLGTMHIDVGEREDLRVEAEDNLLEYIESDVRNGRLRIDTQANVNLRSTRQVNYYVTVTDLDTIIISSSGDIRVPDLEAERFSVTSGSSGDLEMGDLIADAVAISLGSSGDLRMENVEAETLTVDITSSGDVTMGELYASTLEVHITGSGNLDIAGGEVGEQDITISSSGDYTARDLESVEAEVHLSGSGSATIQVRDYLSARLSSSGNVRYIGSPTLESTMTSSGDVVQIGD